MYEPATLLGAPSRGQFVTEGRRISATCVAYGSPRPSIQWTQNGLPVMNSRYINVYTQSAIDDDGDILAISTLEICDPQFEFVPEVTECRVRNGVMLGPMEDRAQEADFIIDPRSEFFISYDYEISQFIL